MVIQSVSLGVEPHLGLMTRYLLLFDSYGLDLWGALSNERTGFFICCWSSPAQSFSGRSPLGLATIIYCLRFETSFFVASYDSQGTVAVAPFVFKITPSQELHGKHRLQFFLDACLPLRCLATDFLYLYAFARRGPQRKTVSFQLLRFVRFYIDVR
jgi:hypothetical protein